MDEVIDYNPLPTIQEFHESPAQIRAIIGPVGSGKTSGAAMEQCYYIPQFLFEEYGITKTRHVIIRNTYGELIDTTQKTVFEWFPRNEYKVQARIMYLKYENGVEIEVLFRSCDRPEDIKKLKSLETTTYWIDESIEVPEEIKRMLKNRIGRFPKRCPCRFGIETSNPPDIEHPTYSQFKWNKQPPGPIPEGEPLNNHAGFWQPPYENINNLRPGYYDDLRNDYKDNPDWIEIYIEGKPGVILRGKLVYANFKRAYHEAKEPIIWAGDTLYRGWDNSGNCPACVVLQIPTANQIQILAEFHSDKMGIVDFTNYVINQCNIRWPGSEYEDWADPQGEASFSKRGGGFTSNAELMRECDVDPKSSEQNLTARIQAVDQQLARIDGILIDPLCTRLINGFLGGYCYPEIGNTGEYSDKILKNRFSHVQDALQYVLTKLVKNTAPIKRRKTKPRSYRPSPTAWMGA